MRGRVFPWFLLLRTGPAEEAEEAVALLRWPEIRTHRFFDLDAAGGSPLVADAIVVGHLLRQCTRDIGVEALVDQDELALLRYGAGVSGVTVAVLGLLYGSGERGLRVFTERELNERVSAHDVSPFSSACPSSSSNPALNRCASGRRGRASVPSSASAARATAARVRCRWSWCAPQSDES